MIRDSPPGHWKSELVNSELLWYPNHHRIRSGVPLYRKNNTGLGQKNMALSATSTYPTIQEIAARNINNCRYLDDTTLMAESEEELKSLLMKVKDVSEKAGLKLNIQKAKIMASGPISSRQIDGETMETVTDFIFLGSQITADGDCSHEIKTLTPWKERYDQPRQLIKKQRHYYANKCPSSQSYGLCSGHVQI